MKKFILLVCFLLVSSLSYSELIDNFNYTSGTTLSSNGWTAFSGAGSVPLLVTSPGLTYTDYTGSGVGLATTVVNGAGSREDCYKAFLSPYTSGNVYTSMMVNVTTGGLVDDYFAAYLPTTDVGAFNGRLYCKNDGSGNISFGISKTSAGSGGIFYGPASFTTGVTYLIVLEYVFNTGTTTDDAINLYVFSGAVPTTPPTPYVGPVTGTATDLLNLGRFALRQTTGVLNIMVDGIYTESSWNNSVLPVELSSFSSIINNRDVTLNWATSTETNNSGFEIERSSANSEWSKIGNVAGNGTTSSASIYSFTDRNLASGNYSYRLKQMDFNGNFEYFNLNNEVNIGIPTQFDLSQNYPNPFNPSTTINFDLATDGKVSVKLFDMSGKEVAVLVNEVKTAGYYSVNFNASSLSSGVYFYNITTDNFTATKKMMLVK